ncbi:hypothetical protein OUZ56_011107 [Daphnia magna]|uniref:Transmembrane protein n=1 Tax=Daphnia magna TaxID=35525 RepID=A0ABQ9YZB8_9CRUS|nr:hypothetical protein OUZ56_011107 [Daphnia magna]
MLKRGSSKSYSIEPIYDPKEFSKPAQPAADNGETSSIRDETSKEGLDYAKLMEPAKVRKRRYFSLAVVCFTAFILALSVSIVMTSAKPYLDLLSSFITF